MEYLTNLDPEHPEKATTPVVSGLTWTEPVQYWDFHVYYDDATRSESNSLRTKLLEDFESYAKEGAIIVKKLPTEKAIGPHYDLFWEADIARVDVFAKVLSWFVQHHGNLSVLIHPQTGNDLMDHTKHALWLGEKKRLKTEVFPKEPTLIPEFGVRRIPKQK